MVWREMRSVDLQDGVGASVRSGRGRWGFLVEKGGSWGETKQK